MKWMKAGHLNEKPIKLMWLITLFACLFLIKPVYAETNAIPLVADQAFEFSISFNQSNELLANWHIAPGYYLYRDKFDFTLNGKTLTNINYPQGDFKYDNERGRYEVLSGDVSVPLTISQEGNSTANLTVKYQGCSFDGFCYPPMEKNLVVNFVNQNIVEQNTPVMTNSLHTLVTQQSGVQHLLQTQSFVIQILLMAALGLLLAFTPCVLPMIPILTSIIVGQKNVTTHKALLLSLTYVLGTSLTYAAAGLAAALMGSSLQVWLQTPAVIATVCALFIILAISLFGFFDLRVPAIFQNKIHSLTSKQQGGTFVGVFMMGVISTLIVSPCVTAPLVGVLLYIAQTGNVMFGASALFALGIGMGIPLLLIGVSAGKWLPKSGPWMILTKHIFGLLMLAMAVWLGSRILPPEMTRLSTGFLLLIIAIFLGFYLPKIIGQHLLNRAMGVVTSLCGLMLMFGSSHLPVRVNNWFEPAYQMQASTSNFSVIRNMTEFNQQIAQAEAANKLVILDFYADWCESCLSMEKNVFASAQVKAALSNYVVLRADLSGNTSDDEMLLKHFNVVAPPTVLFFSQKGNELAENRIVGEVSANEFLSRLNQFTQNAVTNK